jgi:ADP-ribose pyrophosphatase YjhB (NUDIX family)
MERYRAAQGSNDLHGTDHALAAGPAGKLQFTFSGGIDMSIVTFYNCDPKDAPKTTMPVHLGANAIFTYNGKLLLEKRRDSDIWGLVGGGCKKYETGRDAIAREAYEELGVRIPKDKFQKLAVYDNPGRIAAYRDGSIWRMVIVVYGYNFPEEPVLRISSESKELRFFDKEEIADIEIAITHADIVADWFTNK